jgi:hypothetical protein
VSRAEVVVISTRDALVLYTFAQLGGSRQLYDMLSPDAREIADVLCGVADSRPVFVEAAQSLMRFVKGVR